MLRVIGDEALTSLVMFASIPPSEMRAALDAVRTPDARWSIIEKSRFNLLYNSVRRKFNMMVGDLLGAAQPEGGQGARPAAASQGATPVVKIKLSQVIIQGRDIEVDMLPPEIIAAKRANYSTVAGDVPMPEQQVTDIQLSAFVRLVELGSSPACDFGVWGPHGSRMERAMYFRAHFCGPDGRWRSTEIKGPENLEAWEVCYDVFKTSAIMDNVASVATLDYYAKKFKHRVSRYCWAWHLALQADWRCRTEFWVEERRTQEVFHASNPALSAFDPNRPWNSVIKASAKNVDFWHEHLAEPAAFYRQNNGPDNFAKPRSGVSGAAQRRARSRSRARSPSRCKVRSPSPKRRGRPGKGGADEQRPDGRYLCAADGTEICYAWSRHGDGCAENCRATPPRAHICEFCRTGHRTVRCPVHKGWRPPGNGPQATSSKRKARGGARR